EGDAFRLALRPELAAQGVVVGVSPRQNVREEDQMQWMSAALIGAGSACDVVQRNRVHGAPRQRIEKVGDVGPPAGVVPHEVGPGPDVIGPGETLEILNTSDRRGARRPAGLVLYVPNK